jgi:YggT family protein
MYFLQVLGILFQVYTIMLFIRVLSSWVPEFRESQIVRFISFCTDPYLDLFRRVIPPIGMIDISPIVAFFALGFIEKGIALFIVSVFL